MSPFFSWLARLYSPLGESLSTSRRVAADDGNRRYSTENAAQLRCVYKTRYGAVERFAGLKKP